MNKKSVGNHGEDIATKYLQEKGHIILDRNINTVFGEIDIISIYEKAIYVFEVKYRQNLEYGFGDDAITPTKIKKIQRSFEVWRDKNEANYSFVDIYLNALIIDPSGKVNEFEVL
jgi:putative endonuclease